ncbi:MAG: hypothetical protein M1608_15235, partial [Candidatus Omnitrophica bacterium]|nr:hypothetical protein [Candidatus Omnitrophota bacterium]
MGRNIFKLLFAVSGLIPLLGLFSSPPITTLLIYTFFVLVYFLKPYLKITSLKIPGTPFLKYALLIVLFGLVVECLAWYENYLARNPNPALLHPQLIPDLLLAIGFYAGMVRSL